MRPEDWISVMKIDIFYTLLLTTDSYTMMSVESSEIFKYLSRGNLNALWKICVWNTSAPILSMDKCSNSEKWENRNSFPPSKKIVAETLTDIYGENRKQTPTPGYQ